MCEMYERSECHWLEQLVEMYSILWLWVFASLHIYQFPQFIESSSSTKRDSNKKMRCVCMCTLTIYTICIALFCLQFYSFAHCSSTHWIKVNCLTCVCATDLLCVSNIYLFVCFLFQHDDADDAQPHVRSITRTHARTQPINTLWLLIVCCLLSLLHYPSSLAHSFGPANSFLVLGVFCHFCFFHAVLPDLLHLLFFHL